MTFTVAGIPDVTQRLDSDGLAALGLAGLLLCPAWTDAVPAMDATALTFTVPGLWYAPCAGMLMQVTDGTKLGLSKLDGTPAVTGNAGCLVFRIHPQARLRIERELVAALQAAGGPPDQSIRPVPSLILITGASTVDHPLNLSAGDKFMVAGTVSMFDEHGLIVDPFAFAACLAAVLTQTPALGIAAPGGAAGTLAAIAAAAPAGRFVHLLDLHGRPWSDPPGANPGVSLYSGAQVEGTHLGDGTVHQWPSGAVLAGRADPAGAQQPPPPALLRFGFATLGGMGTTPLAWPPAGARTPVRDTLRVTVTDPTFHLLGNRTATPRDQVAGADTLSVAEAAPLVRDGSPVTLLPDGRSCLGFFRQAILTLQGGNPNASFTAGPILAASVTFDDEAWPLPLAPGRGGRWPSSPAATPVPGNDATVLGRLAPLRTATTAGWIAGSNDVLITLPATLPAGVAVRLYPVEVLLGAAPDEQPLLHRADGGAAITTGGTDTIVLADPFRLGTAPVRAGSPQVRADAVVAWQSPGGAVVVKIVANLDCAVGADVPRPAAAPTNLLAAGFWRGTASAPLLGSLPRGSFTGLSAAFADPLAFVQGIVRQLTTDQNPREAPRLPTMARTESLLAIQLQPAGGPDLYRSVLTGGWLTREADSHSYRIGNPGAAGAHEVHAPGVAASAQLGFDLWVSALHRARPVVPTADVAGPIADGPNAGLPSNWVLLQANTTSAPPARPATPSTLAGAVLQTVPALVETPELALIPDDSVGDVTTFVRQTLPNYLTMPNQPEIGRQILREVRSCKYGRRDAQWALRRALRHARELVYIETPLLASTAPAAGGPDDPQAAVDIFTELATRLAEEPRLRVVIMVPRTPPFARGYEPWSMYFYAARNALAQVLQGAAGDLPAPGGGTRPRVVMAHPAGVPGRPLVIRTTTVIVDDVWMITGTSSLSRRGLTFDGANDVVLADWALDRSAGAAIRAHRRALMGAHLGTGPGVAGTPGGAPASAVGAPEPAFVGLHSGLSAHALFADVLAAGGLGKLLPVWPGPDPAEPNAVSAHPPAVADPDGRGGANFVTAVAAALGGNTAV
ncbi:hypothetical protein DMA12_12730 [Amycolatopsis balhimycina DSM 5908]|uniref:Uncharacterized protein n=1 Tax=Amycolatopsis balhimycina DSM 5908 TaxID=1081091 RepID=A0A428WRR0_AMYBA|nr:hypothetical protein [Amycolatopsis balhimycina]RSM45739.1 hypothetical protein DMA12_12730 [Amycolatopsis balhimycina DSM 5908]